MQTDNLKYTLLDKLISIRDISLLEKVNELLGTVDLNKPVFKLTNTQKQMLTNSEADILAGDLTSDEDINAEEDRWLNE
jgi:hypothetical protein